MSFLFNVADSTLGGIDEYTKLMLHMDGADDGTVFTDDSASTHSITRFNAVTKTGVKKFGTASGYFDGSDDYLHAADSDDWLVGASDALWTIDFWIKFNSLSGYQNIIGQLVGGTPYWYLSKEDTANKLWYTERHGGAEGSDVTTTSTAFASTGVWYHVAVTRIDYTLKIYIDGVSQGLTVVDPINAPLPNVAHPLRISGTGVNSINGYIDELRFSQGIARWTSNFTPETGPYTT